MLILKKFLLLVCFILLSACTSIERNIAQNSNEQESNFFIYRISPTQKMNKELSADLYLKRFELDSFFESRRDKYIDLRKKNLYNGCYLFELKAKNSRSLASNTSFISCYNSQTDSFFQPKYRF